MLVHVGGAASNVLLVKKLRDERSFTRSTGDLLHKHKGAKLQYQRTKNVSSDTVQEPCT